MNWSTTIVVKEPLHTLLTNVNKIEGGHKDRGLLCNLTLYTLKDQGNYGDEIQTGMYILIALNELQAVLFCRIATQYPLLGRIQRC